MQSALSFLPVKSFSLFTDNMQTFTDFPCLAAYSYYEKGATVIRFAENYRMMTEEQNRDSLREQRRQERESRRRQQWERHIQRRTAHCHNMQHSNKSWVGIVIILIGVVWLLHVLGVPMPDWLFTWPMLLIVIGIFSGIASRFQNFGSFILLFIGLVFLARNFIWPDVDMGKYIWPVVIIFIGIMFLARRRYWERKKEWFIQNHPAWKEHQRRWQNAGWDYWKDRPEHKQPGREGHNESGKTGTGGPGAENTGGAPTGDMPGDKELPGETGQDAPGRREAVNEKRADSRADWLDITTVFGGTQRQVISKNFKGGDLINICGGTELDLTHADIQGTAVIDIVAVWGGIKIAVPPNWQVRINLTHIMAGTDMRKRRSSSQLQDPDKVLVLTGNMFMAGIEVRDML